MYILDVSKTCNDEALSGILFIAKRIVDIIQILGPVLAIIALIILFIKLMTNPEDKKILTKIRNSIIALIILFFVPMIINVVMSSIGEDISSCWNSKKLNNNSSYVDTSNNKDKKNIIKDDEYEKGDKVDNSSTTDNKSEIKSRMFVGDSRTVQMYCYMHDDWSESTVNRLIVGISEDDGNMWSSKGGIGLDWMRTSGIPNVEANLTNGSALIILMGVNDLYNVDNYINYINTKINSWKNSGASVYFVSVNPTDKSYSNLTDDINSFNNKIKTISGIKYIDTNSYLNSTGFTTTDGLHYDKSTSLMIYQYIIDNL